MDFFFLSGSLILNWGILEVVWFNDSVKGNSQLWFLAYVSSSDTGKKNDIRTENLTTSEESGNTQKPN